MNRAAGMVIVLGLLWASGAAARPADPSVSRPVIQELPLGETRGGPFGTVPLVAGAAFDTTWYGGSVFAADSNRWEALRGTPGNPGRWTFNSGVGSNFTETTRSTKAAGLHHRMEGWYGIDNTFSPLPWFRRSTTCVLNGTYSLWAGITLSESLPLCYASGQGYGNQWNLTVSKTLNYAGTGSATLSYRYQTDSEPGYDYLNVLIDSTGTGAADDVPLRQYDGVNAPATASVTLTPGVTLRSTAGPVTIKVNVTSDGAYSDEDGDNPTACGHSTIDDIRLTGALVDFTDFEAGSNGWVLQVPTSGPGGDWSDIRALSSLPPVTPNFCPCSVSDSVLVFADLSGGHSLEVDNMAASPWIDLKAGGDVGRAGKLLSYEGYFDLPLTNYIFVQTAVSYYPAVCQYTGKLYTKPFSSNPIYFWNGLGLPKCTVPGSPVLEEFSGIVPAGAEQMRVAVGVLTLCASNGNCTGVSNSTPWFDNISVGVFGGTYPPMISLRTIDVFQDNFAADGTLHPAAAGRVDVNIIKGAASPGPATVLGDTLIVNGDGGNTEVRVVFRVRPGPYTSVGALSAWAGAKWTTEPGLGAGWYSARLDSAEQNGTKTAAKWMGTLHELDPKFGGGTDTDRGGEGDLSQLSHDIFPDHILTPGSRLDYFAKARYLPPDPRNPGGTSWSVTPDTTGGRYLEVEVLPSSMAHDTTWNCTLYVDHHSDRDYDSQRIEELGLTGALGGGGANAEGTRFDRYDVQAPSSHQASLGRPLYTNYGASNIQIFAYKAIAWHSGNLASFNLVKEDANLLTPWLLIRSAGANRFWGSGDGLARSIASEGEAQAQTFLNAVCGVRLNCDTIRLATCPAGSVLDSTFCLPLTNVAGAWFASTLPVNARGNGCPNVRSFDLLTTEASISTAKGQLAYAKLDGVKNYASVANYNTIDVDYKTVIDGVGVGVLRDPNGDVHNQGRCDIQTPALTRTGQVFGWFQSPYPFSICGMPGDFLDADPGTGAGPLPGFRTHLGNVYPNPMNPTARISFTSGREGDRVHIAIYDVTGRLVRTLLDEPQTAGLHEVGWDGRDERGRAVSSGLYFVRLSSRDTVHSKKIVVSR